MAASLSAALVLFNSEGRQAEAAISEGRQARRGHQQAR